MKLGMWTPFTSRSNLIALELVRYLEHYSLKLVKKICLSRKQIELASATVTFGKETGTLREKQGTCKKREKVEIRRRSRYITAYEGIWNILA